MSTKRSDTVVINCTKRGCSGTLVKVPDEQFKGHFSSPECKICGTVYPTAPKNVPEVVRARKTASR